MRQEPQNQTRINIVFAWLLTIGLAGHANRCCAEETSNREALNGMRRIAIVTPFFCTVSPQELAPPPQPIGKGKARVVWPKTPGPSAPHKAGKPLKSALPPHLAPAPIQFDPALPSKMTVSEAEKSFRTQTLKSLAETMQTALPACLAQNSRYALVPEAATQQALRAFHWRSNDLFEQHGQPGDGKFPAPDVKRIQQIARGLHADAVFVASMRGPASIGDGIRLPFELWQINPFNLGVRRTRAHVLSPRVQAFLITAQGVTVWHDEQMADHPRTTPHTLKTLLVDWQEATEQVAQQLADSLQRRGQESGFRDQR